MATKKISEFTTLGSLSDTDILPVVNAGSNKKITGATLKTYAQSGLTIPTDVSDLTDTTSLLGGGVGTLDSVTDTGSTTTNGITVGSVTLTNGAVIKDTAGDAVAFGQGAGTTSQGANSVAVGAGAGSNNQGYGGVAVGKGAGATGQGIDATAIGTDAGATDQGGDAVAVGESAGYTTQGGGAVAVGNYAGHTTQGTSAVAIGTDAGETNQGANAIAVGQYAGTSGQPANSIVINASGVVLNGAAAGFYVNPVRSTTSSARPVVYDTTTKELFYTSTLEFINSTISTSDSSGITVDVQTTFNTDVTVENDLNVTQQLRVRGSRVINITELQAISAASTSFSDFQARIAALV